MSNRNFNKQTTNARQGLAEGGTAKGKLDGPKRNLREKERKRPRPLDNIRSKGDKMKESLTDKMKKIERPRPKKLSESPERIKRQADYMKKHGKNEPRRKTLSVKNTYKKEVEGLKK